MATSQLSATSPTQGATQAQGVAPNASTPPNATIAQGATQNGSIPATNPGNSGSKSNASSQDGASGPSPNEKAGQVASGTTQPPPPLPERLASMTSWTKERYRKYQIEKRREIEYIEFIAPEQSTSRPSCLLSSTDILCSRDIPTRLPEHRRLDQR